MKISYSGDCRCLPDLSMSGWAAEATLRLPATVKEALAASHLQAGPQALLLAGGQAFLVPATILAPLVPLDPIIMALATRGLARVEVLLPETTVEELLGAPASRYTA